MCRGVKVRRLYLDNFSYLIQCPKYAFSNSLSLSLSLSLSRRRPWALGPCLRTIWPDDSLLSPVHLVVLLLQFHLFILRLWNPDLFTWRKTGPKPAVFDCLSLPHLLSLTQCSAMKSHLLLRCWPVAPSTTNVIIINIWPCRSSMNIWTSWPCTVIVSIWHSQKRTAHPSEPGSSLGFFLGSCISWEFVPETQVKVQSNNTQM